MVYIFTRFVLDALSCLGDKRLALTELNGASGTGGSLSYRKNNAEDVTQSVEKVASDIGG